MVGGFDKLGRCFLEVEVGESSGVFADDLSMRHADED
jgi:hypothetical protein